jgi:phosphoglycolate phosphatase
VVVCGDDVRRRKPAPDMVQRGLDRLGLAPGADVWFVGDSTTDTVAAKLAGVTAIYYNGAKWEPSYLERIFPGEHRPDAIAGDFVALEALAIPERRRAG